MAEPDGLTKLAALLQGLKVHSKFALSQAIQAKEIDGLGATLIIQIKADPRKPVDCYFSTTPNSLVSELWRDH